MRWSKRSLFHFSLIALTALALAYRLFVLSGFEYILFIDRDLYRALHIFSDWSNLGPELSWGGRVPGAFYYLSLRGLMTFGHHPLFLYVAMIVGQCGVGAAYFFLLKRHWGKECGLIFLALFFCLWATLENSISIWNPSFAFLYTGFGLFFLLRLLLKDTTAAYLFPASIFFFSAAAQCHLSHAWMILFAFILAFIFRSQVKKWSWIFAILVLLVMYVPYLIEEQIQGWPNLRAILASAKASFGGQGPYQQSWEESGPASFMRDFFGGHLNAFWGGKRIEGPWLIMATALGPLAFVYSMYLWWKNKKDLLLSLCFILFVSGFLLNLAVLGMDELCFRRSNFLFFPVAMILALGISHLTQRPVVARAMQLWSILFLGLNLVVFHQGYKLLSYLEILNFKTLYSMVYELKQKLGVSSEVVEENLSLLLQRGQKWQFNKQNLQQEYPPKGKADMGFFEYTAVAYLNRIIPSSGEHQSKECVLVLVKDGVVSFDQRFWPQLTSEIPLLRSLHPQAFHQGEFFNYVFFNKIEGNCPKTFTNRYLPTEREKALTALPGPDIKVDQLRPAPFKVQLSPSFKSGGPMRKEVVVDFFTSVNVAVRIGFEFIALREEVEVRIDSLELRGYDSITHFHLLGPELHFVHKADKKTTTYWPVSRQWQDQLLFLPPFYGKLRLSPGSYEVFLSAEGLLSKYAY